MTSFGSLNGVMRTDDSNTVWLYSLPSPGLPPPQQLEFPFQLQSKEGREEEKKHQGRGPHTCATTHTRQSKPIVVVRERGKEVGRDSAQGGRGTGAVQEGMTSVAHALCGAGPQGNPQSRPARGHKGVVAAQVDAVDVRVYVRQRDVTTGVVP